MFISNETFKKFEGKTWSTEEAMLLVEKLVRYNSYKILRENKPKIDYREQIRRIVEKEDL